MIAVPQTFKLGGRTWEVRVVSKEEITRRADAGDEDILGLCIAHDAEILLQEGQKPATLQHTFYHELTHALCETLGWKRLNKNEAKVDALGGLLYQYLQTKKGRT